MSPLIPLGLISLALVLFLALWRPGRRRVRRSELLESPLPPEWEEILATEFPRFAAMPPDLQQEVGGVARILAEEKNFEACGGLDEVPLALKALICAQAALLIVRLPRHGSYYPKLRSILIYPGAFRDRGERRFDLPEFEDRGTLVGESWETGSLILSRDNVIAGARNADDGMNVVIHEFAHQLDQLDGIADGVPLLRDREAYRRWAEVFERNYEDLVDIVNTKQGHETLIDAYGATHPAEFFAVASETFFEESLALSEDHPDLYDELSQFYGLDPASWSELS